MTPLGCAGGSAPTTGTSRAQLDFGVQMARRGLWNEALFRFEQAQRTAPGDARLLNNLAVAYEAVGRYDEALATYQQAVRLAPGDSSIRRNLSRFSQFYESFRPQEGESAAGEPAPEAPAETPEPPAESPESPAESPGEAPTQSPEEAM
ncbi:MAG: tetratricopeptide repeat protein [Thermoanaerobaculia bacterium]